MLKTKSVKTIKREFSKVVSKNMFQIVEFYKDKQNTSPDCNGKMTQGFLAEKISKKFKEHPLFPKDDDGNPLDIISISKERFSNILSFHEDFKVGAESPQITDMIAFCYFFDMEISDLLRDLSDDNIKEILNKEPLSIPFEYEEKEFPDELTVQVLKTLFKDEKLYAFRQSENMKSLSSIFAEGETTLECHYVMSPLDDNFKKLMGENILQRGTLQFSLEGDVCHVVANFKNTKGATVTYRGFTVVLEPNSNSGLCWCFLRLAEPSLADLAVFCFRLRGNEGNRWKTRVAKVLTINSVKSRPIICRALISKRQLEDSELEYFKGHLKLNRSTIHISENILNQTRNFLRNIPETIIDDEELLLALKTHFNGANYDTILELLEKLITFHSNVVREIDCDAHTSKGLYNLSVFKNDSDDSHSGALLLSWLRKNSSALDNYQILGRLDEDVEDVLKLVDSIRH